MLKLTIFSISAKRCRGSATPFDIGAKQAALFRLLPPASLMVGHLGRNEGTQKRPEGSEMQLEEGQSRPGDISGRREEIMVQSLRSSSAVRAPVLHIDDSSPGFSVGDSVGHTAFSLSTGILGGVVEEDGWFRPKSMDLLGDCRVINLPGLPGTSFRPSEGGVVPEMDSLSGTQMSIRSWNCPSNYIQTKSLTVDDGRCHPKLKYKRGKGVS